MVSEKEVTEALAEREYWTRVGKIIHPDMRLFGWSYRSSASFDLNHTTINVDGMMAEVLLRQQKEIADLRWRLSAARN